MDILSSQASIAGYQASLLAANHLNKYFPMLITAAGTISPAKILVVGAGVAGLQAIATCNRLGAKVTGFDVRESTKEQVESVGGKFLQLDYEYNDSDNLVTMSPLLSIRTQKGKPLIPKCWATPLNSLSVKDWKLHPSESNHLSGYKKDINEVVNNSLFKTTLDDMIVVKNVEFSSICEHEMTPFFGMVNLGYIPNKKIIGLSKIPKIIEIFSKRLQVQENLTNQISSALDSIISPRVSIK